MEQELHKIIIIPARFVEKRENKYVIKCLLDDDYCEDRLCDEYSLMGMQNPKYLFIGIMTGVGYSQINFVQADEYEKMFKRKWKVLTK
jgi:hypothetical protein